MSDVYENREKQKVYPLCIDIETIDGNPVKTYAHKFFGDVSYLGKLIEACPILFNQNPWNRKDKAIKEGFFLKEDFTKENEIMLVDKVKLKHFLREHISLISLFKDYIRSFRTKTSRTISKEVNLNTLLVIKDTCEDILANSSSYSGEIVSSIRNSCLFGFIPQNELFEIIKRENPAYLLEKNKANKYTFVDGKLNITLW